jgi:hypothetical protein
VKEGEYGGYILYENRTMKLVEIFLRRGRMRETDLIKICCKHIHKCHNVCPLHGYYMQILKYFAKKIEQTYAENQN